MKKHGDQEYRRISLTRHEKTRQGMQKAMERKKNQMMTREMDRKKGQSTRKRTQKDG